MTGNINSSSKGKTGKKTVIEDVEDDLDELTDSYFSKAAAGLFDEIHNYKDGLLLSSKFDELIETIGQGFHSYYLVGHMQKVYPNESGSLDSFAFVMWYLDKEVSLESA